MIQLDTFKDKHKDQDIYVIGSGPSLNFIHPSFFDNKITIGINQIYKKVKTTYLVRKENKLLDTVLKETTDVIHFISRGNCGSNNSINLNYIKKHYPNNQNIVVYNHNPNLCKTLPKNLPNNGLIVSWSTITTGIHLAAYMGAKNIILVGHDCGSLDQVSNTKNYHSNQTYKIIHPQGEKGYKIWLSKIESQTIQLKKMIRNKFNAYIYSLNPFINFGLEGHKYTR